MTSTSSVWSRPSDLVLDAHVRELDVALLVARQVVLVRPGLDFQRASVRSAVAVAAIAIPLLQELLELGLQLVLEHDSVDLRTGLVQALGLFEVGAVDGGVVLQLARSLDAVVEGLAVACLPVAPVAFEKLAPGLGQRDPGGVAVDADGLHQAGFPEVPELAVAWVEWLAVGIAQVAGGDDAEGADGRQRAAFETAEHVDAVAHPDVLPFASPRQVDVPREDLPQVGTLPLPLAGVATAASTTAQLARAAIAVPPVIVPTWVVHRRPP